MKFLDLNGLSYFWTKITTYVNNLVSNFYTKPSTGIPKTDLASDVQTSLGKADTAMQPSDQVVKSVDDTASHGIALKLDNSGELGINVSQGTIGANQKAFVSGERIYDYVTNQLIPNLAPINSPNLTGTPTAPTAATGDKSTQIANCAFVTESVAAAQIGAASFQGDVNSNSDISNLTTYKKGWYWVVATAGTYVGEICEVGDFIFCTNDRSTSYSALDFKVLQTNLDLQSITNSEIDNIILHSVPDAPGPVS